MATRNIAYGTSTAMTITLNSLASSATAARESTVVDNSSNKFIDALVQLKVTLQAGSPANDKAVYVYLYASEDGSTYTDNATGSDAAVTLRDPTALILAQIIPVPDSGGLAYEGSPFGVAQFFGGILPRKWGVVVRNYTGVTLHASAGNALNYTGITETIA